MFVIVLLEVLLDGAQYTREGFAVESEKDAAVGLHTDAEGSLVVVDEGELAEVRALLEGSDVDVTTLVAFLDDFEAIDFALLDDVKLLALVTLVKDKLILFQGDSLQSIDESELLVLVQLI